MIPYFIDFCFNLCTGGAQKKSRPGYFYTKEGEKIVQDFVYQEGPDIGMAKGLKVILFPSIPCLHLPQVICEERFGAAAIQKKKHCDLGEKRSVKFTQLGVAKQKNCTKHKPFPSS